MEEFDKAFTGICLTFEPGETFEPGGRPKSMVRYAVRRLRGAGSAMLFTALLTVFVSLLGIISPAFSRVFLDRILTGQDAAWLWPFLLLLTGFVVLRIAASCRQYTPCASPASWRRPEAQLFCGGCCGCR
jgi:ABC-type bacteriocin/lantibiotic exporter with double-glycine peptidase domain